MKVVDDTTQEETKAQVPDRALDDMPSWPLNSKQTDVGDPLSGELPPLCLHQGRDHVTGTGYGPSQAQGVNGGGDIECGYQFYANMRKGARAPMPGDFAGVNGAATTIPPREPDTSLFDANGIAKDRYEENDYGMGSKPQMEQTLTWRTTNALKNYAMSNPWLLSGSVPGAMAGAATLGLAGLGGSWLWNKLYKPKKDEELKSKNWGLGGLALGAGLGGLAGHLTSRNHPLGVNYQGDTKKVAYSIHARDTNQVEMLLTDLMRIGLPSNLLQDLRNRVRALSQPEAQRLRAAIGGMSGFAAGAFLAKHFRLATLPGLGLSLAGGFLGANLFGASPGRRHQNVADFNGRAF